MDFDIQGARRAGYSEAEIADHLAGLRGFDAPAARSAGYSDGAIVSHLIEQAPARRAAREANSGVGGYIDSLGRQFAQGATFGVMDEGAALARTGGGLWGDYGGALAQERARDDTFRQDNPVAATVANIAGAVASPAGRVGLIRQGAQAGAGLAQRLLFSGATRGAVAGATGGALAGAGEGEGLAGRAAGALQGAAMGGALGGVVGAGVSAAAPVAGRVMDYLGVRNPGVAADRQILRANERAMAGGAPDMIANPRPVEVEGQALVDALGSRPMTNLAATAANTPSAAMEAADRLVQSRRMARPDRIAAAVDDGFGGGGGTRVADDVAALRQQRTTDAAPLYADAFAQEAPNSPALARIMEQPMVQEAAATSFRNQQMQAVARGEAFEPNPMRMLDAAKRGLDERIGATLDPVTRRVIPGRGEENIALSELRDALVRELDTVPQYAAARAAWAGPTRSMEAIDQGRAAYGMDRDVVARTFERLSPSDRDFFRIGMGRAITDAARSPREAPSVARRFVEDRTMQARLQTAIPDPEQRARFVAAMQREVDMVATENAISPRAGSQTARLTAGGEDMGRDPPGGALASLLLGRPVEAGRQAIGGLYRATQGINSKTADALAERLFNTDPAQQAATLERLLSRRGSDQLSAETRAALAQTLLRGTGAGVALSANN